MSTQQAETMITQLAEMTREQVIALLKDIRCNFRIDFTEEYLGSVSIEQLRHIALAAYLHAVDPRKSAV